MSALVRARFVVSFIRRLPGSSQPILVKASDDFLYVVKFSDNPQGPNVLFNEVMGTELYKAFGLPVPEWRVLFVTDQFLDDKRTWFETETGLVRRTAGFCFGSRYLGGKGDSVWQILPGSYIGRVSNRKAFGLAWLIDACAQHTDNRQAVFLSSPDGALRTVFIDHGHMFGGPCSCDEPHPGKSSYLDPRIYDEDFLPELRRGSDMLNTQALWTHIRNLPPWWYTRSATERFKLCIARLTDPQTLRNLRDSIVDIYRRTLTRDRATCSYVDRLAPAILCAGSQHARLRCRAAR